MQKSKNITLIFEHFSSEHLGKDPFLVPYYLGKMLGYTVCIVYPKQKTCQNLPSEINGVKMIQLPLRGSERSKEIIRYSEFYKYVWNNALKIDLMMRFFDIPLSRKLSIIYKIRNPHGKFYLKMDANPLHLISQTPSSTSVLGRLKFKLLDTFSKRCIDIVSCETKLAFDNLRNSESEWNHWGSKMVLMPNGFDEELFAKSHIIEKNFTEKANVMITVGRLGTPPKNTSMLLKALEKVEMRDWKCYLIGSIEDSFQNEITSFYERCPEKINNVIFTGPIYDKKELWEYYNNSKLFVLSSKFESFALVYVEAKRFGNYILTTPVGAAFDVTADGKYGDLVCQDDADMMAEKIQKIIDGETNVDVYSGYNPDNLSWENCVRKIVEKMCNE